jgi:hypothetical protein
MSMGAPIQVRLIAALCFHLRALSGFHRPLMRHSLEGRAAEQADKTADGERKDVMEFHRSRLTVD